MSASRGERSGCGPNVFAASAADDVAAGDMGTAAPADIRASSGDPHPGCRVGDSGIRGGCCEDVSRTWPVRLGRRRCTGEELGARDRADPPLHTVVSTEGAGGGGSDGGVAGAAALVCSSGRGAIRLQHCAEAELRGRLGEPSRRDRRRGGAGAARRRRQGDCRARGQRCRRDGLRGGTRRHGRRRWPRLHGGLLQAPGTVASVGLAAIVLRAAYVRMRRVGPGAAAAVSRAPLDCQFHRLLGRLVLVGVRVPCRPPASRRAYLQRRGAQLAGIPRCLVGRQRCEQPARQSTALPAPQKQGAVHAVGRVRARLRPAPLHGRD